MIRLSYRCVQIRLSRKTDSQKKVFARVLPQGQRSSTQRTFSRTSGWTAPSTGATSPSLYSTLSSAPAWPATPGRGRGTAFTRRPPLAFKQLLSNCYHLHALDCWRCCLFFFHSSLPTAKAWFTISTMQSWHHKEVKTTHLTNLLTILPKVVFVVCALNDSSGIRYMQFK